MVVLVLVAGWVVQEMREYICTYIRTTNGGIGEVSKWPYYNHHQEECRMLNGIKISIKKIS